jgi:hypothetical protein
MLSIQAEAYSLELHHCNLCKRSFRAPVVTWIDVARTPEVKKLLFNGAFNLVTCPYCRNTLHSDAPFFYEDFAEGLLVAVFPRIPANHLSVEANIRQEYHCYPTLEFFYDLTQLWFLIYLREYYKTNVNANATPKIGGGERRLRTFLQFLKQDPLMLAIRDTLIKTILGNKTNEELEKILWYALIKLEDMFSETSDVSAFIGPRAL